MRETERPGAERPGDEESRGSREARRARPRRPWGLWLAGGSLAVAAVAQLLARWTDHQITNIATAALVSVAAVGLLGWWSRGAAPTRAAALVPPLLLVLAAGVSIPVFRFAGVSGELVPQFEWRFASEPAPPEASDQPVEVSLRSDAEAFPGFLGPERRAVLAVRSFGLEGLADLTPEWRQSIGAGWSGFSVAGEYAVTMEQRGDEEWITCYAVRDGRLVWHHASEARHEHPLGGVGPRSTPTIAGGRVYAQGATGQVWCLDGRDGSVIWNVDLLQRTGIGQAEAEAAVTWGRSGSPLVVASEVILPLGGPAGAAKSLIALDALRGEIVWTGGDSQISYASPVLATLAGARQILSVNEESVSGHDPETGAVLWEHPWPGSSNAGATVSQPMPFGDDSVLVSKGYGGGGMRLQIDRDAEGQFAARPVWQSSRVLKTKFTNPAIRDGYAYALSDGSLECVDLADGSRQWMQPRRGRYGHGQLLMVEDVLVIQTETGEVAFVRADPERFDEIARLPAIKGKSWNYPAISGRRLLVRNAEQAACFILPEREAGSSGSYKGG